MCFSPVADGVMGILSALAVGGNCGRI